MKTLKQLVDRIGKKRFAISLCVLVLLPMVYSFGIMSKPTKITYERISGCIYMFNFPDTVRLESANYYENEYGSNLVCLISAETALKQRKYDFYFLYEDGTMNTVDNVSFTEFEAKSSKMVAQKSNVNELAVNLRLWLFR